MQALTVINQLKSIGIALSIHGENIRAIPKAALTNDVRQLIRINKSEIMTQLKKLKQPTLASAITDTSPSGTCGTSDKSRISAKKDTSGTCGTTYSDRIPENNSAAINEPLALDDFMEVVEERAAIMEYDGGLSRAEAEKAAIKIFRPYYFRCTDGEGVLRTDCETIEEVRQSLIHRFGDKFIEVKQGN